MSLLPNHKRRKARKSRTYGEHARAVLGLERHELLVDPVFLVLPTRHPSARAGKGSVPLRALRDEVWASGHRGMGWDDMFERTCRRFGGFDTRPYLAQRSPAHDAGDALGIEAVEMDVRDGVVRLVRARPVYTLEELLAGITPENQPTEIFDDGPRGEEIL